METLQGERTKLKDDSLRSSKAQINFCHSHPKIKKTQLSMAKMKGDSDHMDKNKRIK